ncbi:MAG: lytic murein transglycosylase [Mesorhizobium sp.]|nr:MAG: lytic murein transglycosylase [Mesorhizobium sp.]TIL38765.1 MAG: lytic murein transglycosylase [Mesorhizobium sp.]TIM48417.1 MAG: lytic murein transglycosylase [Mesorhizobium sp.]
MRGVRPATPLCPAGHLPLKGGDWLIFLISPIAGAARFAPAMKPPISPLEGEMPRFGKEGRAEGGA